MAGHQAQAGAIGLGGEERAEQAVQGCLVHAHALVADTDTDLPTRLAAGTVGHQAQAAAIGHGLDGIERQVQQHLLQLGVVGLDRHAVIGNFQLQVDIARQAALEQHAHRLEQALQHDALTGLARATHEGQHRLDHLMAAPPALGDDIGQADDLGVVAAVADQVRHDQQRLQDVAQVMAEAGRQQSQAFQPLGAHQFILDPLPLDLAARFTDGARHCRRQAHRLVLDDVVVGALVQGFHRRLLTHRAGDEDERHPRVQLAQDLQRLVARKPGHAQVRQHDVRRPVGQHPAQRHLAVHPLEAGLQAGLQQLVTQQFGVFRRILHQQDAHGAQRCTLVRHWLTRRPEPG